MSTAPEHFDVVIVGAGISGIGAAHYVRTELPTKSFVLVEARKELGGTWSLFKYPGVRSDSELYTFGYAFRPWHHKQSIARGELIMEYLQDTVRDEGIGDRIRYEHHVVSAAWSSDAQIWRLNIERGATREPVTLTCDWLYMGGGYYRYDKGYSPAIPGMGDFEGPVIHPQFWPDEFDYAGKRVVVIGSGATAVTLVPAMAKTAQHVTMLQRTPTYILSQSSSNAFALRMQRWFSPEHAHAIVRWRSIQFNRLILTVSRRWPKLMRRLIRSANKRALPEGYPVDRDFRPPYDPWDQRLCAVPDGDFFAAIRTGRASVVTDRIRTVTRNGIELESGNRLDADIIITATGLVVQAFGGVQLIVDGGAISLPEHVTYRGMMLSGVPNFVYSIGYTTSSWTLKISHLCNYFTRLVRYMDTRGFQVCTPRLGPNETGTRPILDFGAGYIQRAMNALPRQGTHLPWITSMDYKGDVKLLRRASVRDKALEYRRPTLSRTRVAS